MTHVQMNRHFDQHACFVRCNNEALWREHFFVVWWQVEAVLEAAYQDFSCDAFQLDSVTQGHPLSTLAYFLLHKTGLIITLGLNAIKTARFLRHIESGYSRGNPYHNATHAADVLQVRGGGASGPGAGSVLQV